MFCNQVTVEVYEPSVVLLTDLLLSLPALIKS